MANEAEAPRAALEHIIGMSKKPTPNCAWSIFRIKKTPAELLGARLCARSRGRDPQGDRAIQGHQSPAPET
jgi:hypothetical protein